MFSYELDNAALLERAVKRALERYKTDVDARALMPDPQILEELQQSCPTSIALLERACQLYAQRPAIGYRRNTSSLATSSATGMPPPTAAFTTISYTALGEKVTRVAAGLRYTLNVRAGERIGICGPASVDYLVADFAALYLGATSVPLQTNTSPSDFSHILGDAAISCLFLSAEMLDRIKPMLSSASGLRQIVITDLNAHNEETERFWRAAIHTLAPSLDVASLHLVERAGAPLDAPAAENKMRLAEDPLVSIMYTSGSTGSPKGAMFTESIWHAYWKGCLSGLTFATPYIWVNFMPFNHVMGRLGVVRSLMLGGTTYLTAKSDMSTLIEDIQLARPTMLSLVPRVAVMIYQHYQLTLAKWRRDGVADAEESLMARMRTTYLGDRLVFASNGSAPLAREIAQFIRRCFDIPLFDGYGSTEAGIITFDHHIRRENVIDYKLVDVPGLAYTTSDQPYPRGELRVKCRQAVPGYLNNGEASGALFDQEGYLKTGDIVEERAADHVVWIDRIKNVLKLAQGEFVNTWQLESIFAGGSAAINQIYLYGSPLRAYLLAVVVPAKAIMHTYLGEGGDGMAALKQYLHGEIRRIGAASSLRSFEVPRDFLVETTPFAQEEGLLTESNKFAHRKLKAKYEKELDTLYEQLDAGETADLSALASASSSQMVMAALHTILGTTPPDAAQRFIDLGGDSLDAVRLGSMIEQISGIAIPVGMILSPTSTLGHLVAYLDAKRGGAEPENTLTFAKVHGVNPQKVSASDLAVDNIFSPDVLAAARGLSRPAALSRAKVVLLTGANGFLGRFLTLALLQRLPPDGRLYCMVRAASHEEARERLFSGFLTKNGAGRHLVDMLQNDRRLVALAGDLVGEQLGLDDELYETLATKVDTIVHNGALVNHSFTYQQLFEPNVLGSIALMQLAMTRRIKSFNFISSVGVAAGLAKNAMVMEEDDVRKLWPERALLQSYAAGYSTSKWASEVLLKNLSEAVGMPVNIFRCGMILAHSSQAGQINAADFFTRLLVGVVATGIAPASFYADGIAGAGAHFGGLPVDFIAGAISAIALRNTEDHATYHVINPHWEAPVSLDLIVEWIRSFGYPVETIDDHARWYQNFRKRLESLDDARRSHSPLPIVYQWERPLGLGGEMHLGSGRFVAKVSEIAQEAGEPALIPHLDEAYIHKCLWDVCQLAILDPPPRSVQVHGPNRHENLELLR